jgi:hypothetical protein
VPARGTGTIFLSGGSGKKVQLMVFGVSLLGATFYKKFSPKPPSKTLYMKGGDNLMMSDIDIKEKVIENIRIIKDELRSQLRALKENISILRERELLDEFESRWLAFAKAYLELAINELLGVLEISQKGGDINERDKY